MGDHPFARANGNEFGVWVDCNPSLHVGGVCAHFTFVPGSGRKALISAKPREEPGLIRPG